MCSWCKNPLNRIVPALPISEIQQEQLTEEEEENGKRRQSDDSKAALDDSTVEHEFWGWWGWCGKVDEAMLLFQMEKTKPLQFWKANSRRFPFLSIVSRDSLAVPASSGWIVRAYSTGADILTAKGNWTKPDLFSNLMLIKCNAKVNAATIKL